MSRVRRRADQPELTQRWDNEAQELIIVHWASEQIRAIIHFFIVHAQVCIICLHFVFHNKLGSVADKKYFEISVKLVVLEGPLPFKFCRIYMLPSP